ncbi:hypothetical protein FMUND_12342 [Fusarium mundagurra]|uniref:Uncharacterized protein n=1 Tax=Fusarium mundagurra TaxID=1567541 RepID=A0A8H5Y2X7_9HYPO|nr:hypothetical protein FMUND_12342 [Fusarium mundagurra]
MSDHHIEHLPLSSSSKEMTSSRPQHQEKPAQQEGTLALLPAEILLHITGEPGKDIQTQTLSHQDFKSLALSCGKFFQGIYEIISTLHDHGYSLPYNMNLHKYHITPNDQKSKPDLIRKPMDVALRSHCPTSFLELLLKEYQSQGVNLTTVYNSCPSEIEGWVGNWFNFRCWSQSTNLGNLLWGLFLDIADPLTGWKESYQGEAADILERKIQVLIEYGAVTPREVLALRSIVAALRDNPLDSKLTDGENDGKEYWEKLCSTLRPFLRDGDFLANDLLRGMKLYQAVTPQRLHSFIIEAKWNPWMVWYHYEMQSPQHRVNLSHPWMKHWKWKLFQRRDGKWYDFVWVTFAEVNYDEFVAAVERLWEEEDAKAKAKSDSGAPTREAALAAQSAVVAGCGVASNVPHGGSPSQKEEREPTLTVQIGSENCVNSKRTCEYPPVKIPLRERRALEKAGATQPWEHVPWEAPSSSKGPELPNTQALVRQLILSSSATTLDCVAIDMPLKSHELFNYCRPFVYGETLVKSVANHNKDCMPYTISDPGALRNAILMAATHFTFKVGSLEAFEHTFLFHRIETVRLVKKWLASGDVTLSAATTKQIATLAYTEFCSGDMQMAAKHLNVIYALPCQTTDPSNTNGKTRDQELSDRYFVLTSTFIHGVQTVLHGILRAEDSTEDKNALSVSHPMRLMHKWYKSEGQYLHCLKLKAIRLFSTFFILPDIGSRLSDVYSASIVNSLRQVNDEFYNLTEAQKIHDDFWRTGAAARVYDAVLESHQNSITPTDHQYEETSEAEQKTSWCGLVIAAELFLEQVVVLWRPFTKEIYLCSMRIFQRDLSFALQKTNALEIAELLFWESFLGLMSIYFHEKLGDMEREPGLRPFFERIIREQSRDMRLEKWEDARRVLLNIAWPLDFSEDDYVKGIWEAAVAD